MKKTFVGILMLATAMALVMGDTVFAKSKDTGGQGEPAATTSEDATNQGRTWTHGKQRAAGNRGMALLYRLDTDKDGKISYDEFIAPHKKRFEEIDKDGDGYLTQEEFQGSWEQFEKKKWENIHKNKKPN